MSDLVSIASTAVNAYQRALGTVSNNIANVDSVGYSRQEVNLAENAPRAYGTSYLGTGVNVDGVKRLYDAFIETSLRNSAAELESQAPMVNYANRVVDIMGSEDVGLVSAFDAFFDAARQLSSDAASPILRSQFLNKTELLTERFQTIQTQLRLVDQETREATTTEVESLNTLAAQLALVNRQLGKVRFLDRQPPALLDQRDQLLRDMSKLAKLQVTEAVNGVVTVSVGSSASRGQIVQNDVSRPLSALLSETDPSQSTLVINAGSPQAETVVGFSGGSISGLLGFRSQLLKPSFNELDALARTVVREINTIHTSGLDFEGRPGQPLLGIDPQFSLTSELDTSGVSFEARVLSEDVGYEINPIRLTFQSNAGQRENISLGGSFVAGDQITVTLNERSHSFTLSGAAGSAVSLEDVTSQLRQFLDGGDAASQDGAFGLAIEVTQNPSGGLVVTSSRLGSFELSVQTGSDSGRVFQASTRGLWTAEDLVTGATAQGAEQVEINGIAVTLGGTAKDGESLTLRVANSAAAGIRVLVTEPNAVAAAAQFRVIENQFNPSGARANLTEGTDPGLADSEIWLPSVTADDADGRSLDNNGFYEEGSDEVVLHFDRVPVAPIAVVPAGYENTTLYLGDLNGEVVDLQVMTREGVHLLGRHFAETELAEAEALATEDGRELSQAERDAIIQRAGDLFTQDARRAGANISETSAYDATYLNQSGDEAYRNLDLFYGVRAGVERYAPLTLDHVQGEVQVVPASIESDEISITPNSAGVVFDDGDLILNGVSLSALSGFSPSATVDAEDIQDWLYDQDGWGHGEIQTLYFSEAESAGQIVVGGVTVSVSAGDTATTVAGKVRTALNASTFITSYSGRSVTVLSDGTLQVNFTLTDGDPDEMSFSDPGSTGVLMEATSDPRAPGPLGRGEEKTLSFTTPTSTGVVSIAGVSITVSAVDTPSEISARLRTSLLANSFMTANPLRRIELNDDGSMTIRYPYQEGPVDDLELETNATGVSISVSEEPFEGFHAELTYRDNSAGVATVYGLRLSQTVFDEEPASLSEIRLGLGETGRSTDIAKLGFRTGAYLIGKVPEDLIVFASGDDSASPFSLGATFQAGTQHRVEALRASPFEVVFTGTDAYQVRDVTTGSVLATRSYEAGSPISYRGLELTLSEPPQAGDVFLVDGNWDGIGDNGNALRLAALQTQRVAGPGQSLTLSEAYSEIVTDVGNQAFQAAISQDALEVVHDQAVQARDKVSGVSLDEEAADLIRFQQAYQASAKVMQTASTIFDAILQVR